jgi:hypothetical protein
MSNKRTYTYLYSADNYDNNNTTTTTTTTTIDNSVDNDGLDKQKKKKTRTVYKHVCASLIKWESQEPLPGCDTCKRPLDIIHMCPYDCDKVNPDYNLELELTHERDFLLCGLRCPLVNVVNEEITNHLFCSNKCILDYITGQTMVVDLI